jgi:transcriptional regulator GlxA family with amidase domain
MIALPLVATFILAATGLLDGATTRIAKAFSDALERLK